MTVGEKIRYFRKQRGITQNQLAELTGIHPVSIRKYETNKMQPQTPQLERIASALGVNYSAIYGHDPASLEVQTVGDLMGLLIAAHKSGLISIAGERGEDNRIKEDTCRVRLNTSLLSYFCRIDKEAGEEIDLDPDGVKIKDPNIRKSLIQWEYLYYGYRKHEDLLQKEPNAAIQAATEELGDDLEKIEMQLQTSQIMLDHSDGMKALLTHSKE